MKRFNWYAFSALTSVILLMSASSVFAKRANYYIDQDHSYLKGSIKYTLIGTYRAAFTEFEGVLNFDRKRIKNSSVNLKIKTASIKSKYPTLDRIVRSDRLLDADNYPYIVFKSTAIKKVKAGYYVEGLVNLNDITKRLSFVFEFDGPYRRGGEQYVKARGKWVLNRKDFEIIWSRWLDHGGVIVGNDITVDWEIQAFR